MITNTGKNILAKYLVGQTPAYASYMAFGCGPNSLGTGDAFGDYSNKTELDFEMFRVPIISRGFVNDNGISKIVFTAELPTDERYEITEIGIFSAKSNSLTTKNDSRTLYSFATSENWQYVNGSSTTAIPEVYSTLSNPIATTTPFRTNANNVSLQTAPRKQRREPSRYLNDMIILPGDMSTISSGFVTSGKFIELSGISLDLGKYSPNDSIKLAASVISNDENGSGSFTARIVVEFTGSDNTIYARMNISQPILGTDRYFVVEKQLEDLSRSANFSWSSVNKIKIYSALYNGSTISTDAYVALDAIRIDNKTTQNPIYGLTGYTVVKSSEPNGIVKEPNSSGFVEFRFAMDVA